jgi:DNA-binding SARP family transcriptional activator/predicted ATPase/tetratricopeptide (TPR) repeat protein
MARLSLSLLGPFQATLDGQPITGFASDRMRALLAYLAVEADRPHRRETLVSLLWPDWPEPSASTNLRNALSNLRKAIGDRETTSRILLVDRDTIQFNAAGDGWVDVLAFSGLTRADQPAGRWEEGLALYRGPFLEGFSLRDSAPFEEWVGSVREQLQRQCLAALARLAEQHEAAGDVAKACEIAWRAVDLAPWQEESHRRLMRLLALSGQRSVALAQFETCRHLLQRELGVAPAAETIRLYEQIRDGVIESERVGEWESRSVSDSSPLAPSPPPPLSNLPTFLTPFVGRRTLLAQIRERLHDPACRLLTLIGPGGSGKTRLAIEAAAEAAEESARFLPPDGTYFVPLAALQSSDSLLPAIAQAVGFTFQAQGDPRQQLVDYIREKQLLLVLDNFEHLQAGAAVVSDLLGAAPQLKILVTSRTGLNVQGESFMLVPGLSVPEDRPASLAEARQYSSVKLFLEGTRRVYPAFDPTTEDLEQIVRICRLVQGLPLSILLAAAWMRLLSPAEIVAEIAAHSLDFLESEWHDVPERQRSLRAVFDHSWRLLSERERQAFAGLAAFRGGFTYPAAQQVAGATLRELMHLVNHSLLERAATGRYDLHELLRQYGEGKLGELPDGGLAVRDRHAAHYAAILQRWDAELKGPRQMAALTEMDIEIDNARAGWSWAVERGQVAVLAQAMAGLGLYYDTRARYQEGETVFGAATHALTTAAGLASGSAAQAADKRKALMNALAWQARFDQRRGDTVAVGEHARRSLVLAEEAALAGQDVHSEQAFALLVMAEIELWTGNIQRGGVLAAQSLSLYRALEDHWSTAACLRILGRVAERLGNYSQAAQLHQESVAICRVLGTPREMAESLDDVATDLARLGQLEEAERLSQEGLSICRQLEDPAVLARLLQRLGVVLILMGKYSESLTLLEECVAIARNLGDRYRLAHTLMRSGQAHVLLGHYDLGRALLQQSLVLYQGMELRWGKGTALWLLGWVALAVGKPGEAIQLLQESTTAFHKSGATGDTGLPTAFQGLAALLSGDVPKARRRLNEALRVGIEYRDFLTMQFILSGAALLVAEEGAGSRALELQALAAKYQFITSSRFYQDIIGKRIATLTATLSPEIVAAAEQRGRQRDLWATAEELLAEWSG